MTRVLMEGSHAIAEAAIQAGCRFYAGYPITPSTEIRCRNVVSFRHFSRANACAVDRSIRRNSVAPSWGRTRAR